MSPAGMSLGRDKLAVDVNRIKWTKEEREAKQSRYRGRKLKNEQTRENEQFREKEVKKFQLTLIDKTDTNANNRGR